MVTVSDRAKAITAFQTEIDQLLLDSQSICDKQWALHTKFEKEMRMLSDQQKLILEKVSALEVSIQKLIKGE